jgi:phage terminase large subunit-like protein
MSSRTKAQKAQRLAGKKIVYAPKAYKPWKPLSSRYEKHGRVIEFFRRYITHTTGKWKGKDFRILPWQEKLIHELFGTLKKDELRQYKQCYLEIGKKNGKALAIDTPIPTPFGYKLMRDIQFGDKVFDETGNQCSVIFATDFMFGHECFEITFSDGEKIVADAQHLWKTQNHGTTGRKNGSRINKMSENEKNGIHTTEHLLKTLKIGSASNHQIDCTKPLILPEIHLWIPPYTLGAWLGDGKNQNSQISSNDEPIIENIRADGFRVSKSKTKYEYWIHNLDSRLKGFRLHYNKHIPQDYFRASFEQRLSLLQALMDTDGSCSEAGQCEFTNTSKKLVEDVFELLRTLGYIPNPIKEKIPTLNGKPCKKVYRIFFFGRKEIPPFRLERKLSRLKDVKITSRRRRIKSIIPVESVPVKCIAVDSPSHLYLAGKGMIPTHNTELAAALGLYLLLEDGEGSPEIVIAASDRKQASICFNVAAQMVRQNQRLSATLKILDSQKRLYDKSGNGVLEVVSSETASKHGLNLSGLIFDELHAQKTRDLYVTLTEGSGAARRQPLFLYLTTAGWDRKSICWEVHQHAEQVKKDPIKDPTFLPIIHSMPAGADWKKEENWEKPNPALGVIFDIENLREGFRKATQMPSFENDFRRLRLNEWTSQQTKWISIDEWDKCAGKIDLKMLEKQVCYGGLDLSSTQDLTAFVLIFPTESEYVTVPFFFCPQEGIEKRSHHDKVGYDVWARQGLIIPTPGNVIDYAFVEHKILECKKLYNLKELAFDRYKANDLIQSLMDAGIICIPIGQNYKEMNSPIMELEKMIMGRKFNHGGNLVLRWMCENAALRKDPSGLSKFDKERASEKIDGVVALAMAMDRAMRHPKATEPKIIVLSRDSGVAENEEKPKMTKKMELADDDIPLAFCGRCDKIMPMNVATNSCRLCGTKRKT